MKEPLVAVLCGGTSAERDVSLASSKAVAQAMAFAHPTRLFVLDEDQLPDGLDPAEHVVCIVQPGTFGEDGGLQRLLDAGGFSYASADARASELCFNKWSTRQTVSTVGVRVAPGCFFHTTGKPAVIDLVRNLGEQVVLKPNKQGSSVGLQMIGSQVQLETAFSILSEGEWVVEKKIVGRELTVGILGGRPMGIVEIAPKSGVFDYTSKYTKGFTEYHAPAQLSTKVTTEVRQLAKLAFVACGCRDYARADFILSTEGELYFLEINTLPGMKEMSLLPMSARCVGLNFNALCRELVALAFQRFQAARK